MLLGVCGSALLLALEYRPAWYAPKPLTESDLRQARMEAMRALDHVGDELVALKAFDIVLTDDQLNDWLSGLEQIWPDAAHRIPREIVEPFISFKKGRLRTAARIESNGWRAVASSEYHLDLSADKKQLIVRLDSARCGVVTIPRFLLRWCLNPYLSDAALRGISLDQLHEGLTIENRFVWPNGKRPFHIDALETGDGAIRLRIQPL